jgi:hypothetical protein
VAAALSLVLIAFGSAVGPSIISSSPTRRDTSPALAVVSGIYLLLTALLSFGLGGYVAGRLRERWNPTAPSNVVEFRDGTHGVLAWAVAVVAVRADAPSPIDPIDTSGCVAWLGEHERAKRNHDGEHRCATSTEALCSHFGYLLDSTSARIFHRFRTINELHLSRLLDFGDQ